MDPAADPLSHEAAGRSDMSRYVIPAVRLLIQINAATSVPCNPSPSLTLGGANFRQQAIDEAHSRARTGSAKDRRFVDYPFSRLT